MNKRKNLLAALLTLILLALACANPLEAPTSQEPANVETIVAATLAALTASPGNETLPSTPQPGDDPSSLLPRPLLYLANDAAQISQVYRLGRDGKSITQLTFEGTNVDDFDVSPVDGSIVFLSNNQLFTINADGSNRSLIVDGGAQDPNNPIITEVTKPLWSPNGQTIAFGQRGINFYSITSGQSNLTLPAQIDSNGFGLMYWPVSYAPDGNKLLITIAPIASDGFSNAIYYPDGNAVVDLVMPPDARNICCSINWTPDGSAFYAGVSFLSPFTTPGLWRVNTANGQVDTLLSSDEIAETFNLAAAPFPAPDGQLYFIHGSQTGLSDYAVTTTLQMVRSATDGTTGRAILRPESFNSANEFLWAPDASFVLAAIPPTSGIFEGGAMNLYYTDGQPAISLVPFVRYMKWGQ